MISEIEHLRMILDEVKPGGLLDGFLLVEVRITPSFHYVVQFQHGKTWFSINTENTDMAKHLRQAVKFHREFLDRGIRERGSAGGE